MRAATTELPARGTAGRDGPDGVAPVTLPAPVPSTDRAEPTPRGAMSHRAAIATMVVATLLWSIAGVVTLHLETARSFEVTFWRSFFSAATLLVLLPWLRGAESLRRSIRSGGAALWLSGVCWSVMFTAFMLALTLTSVANVLVTMSIAPLFTALTARFALGSRLPLRTWVTVVVAGGGIAWMYAHEVSAGDRAHLLGSAVALGVPIAAAINWSVLQSSRSAADRDLLPAVLIGAAISALATMPFALPFAGSAHDIGWLALLGVAQLAVPCLLAVASGRALSAPEASLLALLEIVFGVTWAWLGGGERPSAHALGGGVVVLAALAVNETLALRARRG